MSNINVYTDDRLFAEGGIFYASQENFPALKILFHHDDLSAGVNTSFLSRVGSVVLTPASAGFTKDATGMYGTADATAPILSGTLPVVGDGHAVTVFTGTIEQAANRGVGFGKVSTDDGMEIRGDDNGYISIDGGTKYLQSNVLSNDIGAVSYPFDGCMSLYGDKANNEARKFAANTDCTYAGSSNKDTGNVGSINQTWDDFFPDVVIPQSSSFRVRQLMLFSFTNVPVLADIETATRWMVANPDRVYPSWAGKV